MANENIYIFEKIKENEHFLNEMKKITDKSAYSMEDLENYSRLANSFDNSIKNVLAETEVLHKYLNVFKEEKMQMDMKMMPFIEHAQSLQLEDKTFGEKENIETLENRTQCYSNEENLTQENNLGKKIYFGTEEAKVSYLRNLENQIKNLSSKGTLTQENKLMLDDLMYRYNTIINEDLIYDPNTNQQR